MSALRPRKCQPQRSGRTVAVLREFSAGGVLVRVVRGRPMVAAIRPRGKAEGVWALPKGQIDGGESAADTAVREVREETGVSGRLVEKLGDVRYVYARRRPAGGGRASAASPTAPPAEYERIFKVVSFFLLRAGRGRIGEIEEEMRIEVAEARWCEFDLDRKLWTIPAERMKGKNEVARPHDREPVAVKISIRRAVPRRRQPAFGASPLQIEPARIVRQSEFIFHPFHAQSPQV